MLRWFRFYGYPLSPWILYLVGIIFGLLTKRLEVKKERATISIFCFFFGTVAMIFQVF